MRSVKVEIDSGVAVIRIHNEPLNLLSREVMKALGETLARIEADNGIRSVVVAGAGHRAFSAGSDIREFPALMETGTVIEEKLAFENAVFDRLARLPQPTIAAIVGVALGGGASSHFAATIESSATTDALASRKFISARYQEAGASRGCHASSIRDRTGSLDRRQSHRRQAGL